MIPFFFKCPHCDVETVVGTEFRVYLHMYPESEDDYPEDIQVEDGLEVECPSCCETVQLEDLTATVRYAKESKPWWKL